VPVAAIADSGHSAADGAVMLGSSGVRGVLPPGFRVTSDNGYVTLIGADYAMSGTIDVSRRAGKGARPATSVRDLDEYLHRHFDHLGSRALAALRREQWRAHGLEGASARGEVSGMPAYTALVGCRGLRWVVSAWDPGLRGAADAIARSLREVGTPTRA